MKDMDLARTLQRLSVETGSLICLGCEHEHACGIHGCAIMRTAADRLEQLTAEPPNEPLTCEGCVSFGEGSDRMPCFGCKRAVRKIDCYRHKPDGGGVSMERYTCFEDGKWRLSVGDTEYSGPWVDRLAAYEDTGLEPEDFKQAFNEVAVLKLAAQYLGTTPDRLRELVKARDEGRVVAPCKVGDTLYTESPIRGMVTSFKAPDLAWIIENISEFGKTVFLTRSEAEAAIGGGGDG